MSKRHRIFLIIFAFISLAVIKFFTLTDGAIAGSASTFI